MNHGLLSTYTVKKCRCTLCKNAMREYSFNYAHSTNGRKKLKAYQSKWRKTEAGVLQHKAHMAVSHSIRDGILVKEPCTICGKTETQAHHYDYTKPLEVIWLCLKHHDELHGRIL
jgi:hypothetical protein